MFEADNTPWGFSPHKQRCPMCGGNMVLHVGDLGQPFHGVKAWVCRLIFKCVMCYFTATHNIPISEEYKDELMRRRNGNKIYAPWNEDEYLDMFTDNEKEQVKKRLASLGYF